MPTRTLSTLDYVTIAEERLRGQSQERVAEMFNVSVSLIRKIEQSNEQYQQIKRDLISSIVTETGRHMAQPTAYLNMTYNVFQDKQGMRILEAIDALEGTDSNPSSCFDISLLTDIHSDAVDALCKGRLQPFIREKSPGQYQLSYAAGGYVIAKYLLSCQEMYTWELQYTRAPHTVHHWWWHVYAKDASDALRLFTKHWKDLDLPYLSNLSSWQKLSESKYSFTTTDAKVELLRGVFDTESYQTSLARRETYLFKLIRSRETIQRDKNLYMVLIEQQPIEIVEESYLEKVSEDIGTFHLAYESLAEDINSEMRQLEDGLASELITPEGCAENLNKNINNLLIDCGRELGQLVYQVRIYQNSANRSEA